ncbi:efflux RND transporter periplasmic adaptor subunit [Robertkochia aurantiaca]|uniref:efflux RND transporter periplasmic adaptor subunit n=1 Tax=Robertkochia aurantiaca TaxID=2873700 RepID=UPI001CCDB3E2|nr:efflux RND transporter periplasmic adaptor subunit [Robertkochia sp. 3YJGBD-33]
MRTILFFFFLSVIFSCKEARQPSILLELPVVTIDAREVAFEREFVGQVYGYQDIPIRARVDGYLEKIHFREGSRVNRGDLLYTIDADPLAEAVTRQESQLAQAETQLAKAKVDLDRIEPLAEINAVSKAELDGAKAAYEAAKAGVNAAKANLNLTQIRYDYSSIEAPITGFIGKSQALEGEYVGQNPNPVILNTISKTDSIKVEFLLTENDYLYMARQRMIQEQENSPNTDAKVELILSDNSVFEHQGRFRFINREIDPETGSILVQAVFPNPDFLIKPGQFAKVRITGKPEKGVVLIPQRAVRELQGKFSAFVLTDSNTVRERDISLSGTYRDYFVVTDGIEEGTKILLEGIQKVREGQEIDPQPTEFESRAKDQ